VVVQLRAKHALGQLLLELPYEPRFPQQALGVTAAHLREQLIQKLVGKRTLGFTLAGLASLRVVGHSSLLYEA